jgi:hypothetical protein
MITLKLTTVDVWLLIYIFPTLALFIQKDKYGCVKFPIALYSAFSCASRQKPATTEE